MSGAVGYVLAGRRHQSIRFLIFPLSHVVACGLGFTQWREYAESCNACAHSKFFACGPYILASRLSASSGAGPGLSSLGLPTPTCHSAHLVQAVGGVAADDLKFDMIFQQKIRDGFY